MLYAYKSQTCVFLTVIVFFSFFLPHRDTHILRTISSLLLTFRLLVRSFSKNENTRGKEWNEK